MPYDQRDTAASAMEDMPVPCFLADPNAGRVVWSNSSAQEWAGKSERQLTGAALDTLFAPVDNLSRLLSRVVQQQAQLMLRDIAFEQGRYELAAYPTGEGVGIVLLPHRVTGPAALRGDNMQKLGQMMGHEIKNPLAGIRGAAQLLATDVNTREGRELLDLIVSEVGRLERLASQLQDFGDTASASQERVNIHTLLRKSRQLLTPKAGEVLFTEDYDPSLPHVKGSADEILQALLNLIKNALEAMGEAGGEITLRTRSRAGVRREGRSLPIEAQIIDTGPGVPAHLRDRVFEPFATTKPNGQGLGLAQVARVVEAHGGLVELDSRSGHTRFSVLLPAAEG